MQLNSKDNNIAAFQPINDKCLYDIETSQFICLFPMRGDYLSCTDSCFVFISKFNISWNARIVEFKHIYLPSISRMLHRKSVVTILTSLRSKEHSWRFLLLASAVSFCYRCFSCSICGKFSYSKTMLIEMPFLFSSSTEIFILVNHKYRKIKWKARKIVEK